MINLEKNTHISVKKFEQKYSHLVDLKQGNELLKNISINMKEMVLKNSEILYVEDLFFQLTKIL